MKFVRSAAVFTLFVAISAGAITGQDKGKSRGTLPANWNKLGLSEDQKTKVYDIQSKYSGKIDELEKQIKDLREKRGKEEMAVLTDAQKAKLKEILTKNIDK